jgi:hypothetical protein
MTEGEAPRCIEIFCSTTDEALNEVKENAPVLRLRGGGSCMSVSGVISLLHPFHR